MISNHKFGMRSDECASHNFSHNILFLRTFAIYREVFVVLIREPIRHWLKLHLGELGFLTDLCYKFFGDMVQVVEPDNPKNLPLKILKLTSQIIIFHKKKTNTTLPYYKITAIKIKYGHQIVFTYSKQIFIKDEEHVLAEFKLQPPLISIAEPAPVID